MKLRCRECSYTKEVDPERLSRMTDVEAKEELYHCGRLMKEVEADDSFPAIEKFDC